MIIGASSLIEDAQAVGHDVQLQVSFSGGYIDLYDVDADEALTSWSDEEIIEYQDQGQPLLADIMDTCMYYDVLIKVVE